MDLQFLASFKETLFLLCPRGEAVVHIFKSRGGLLPVLICWPHRCLLGPYETTAEMESDLQGFRRFLPTSQVGYYAGKSIAYVVYCFHKITSSKTD